MFADDYFCRAIKKAARNNRYMLDHYYRVPIQLFNYYKSKVQFSKASTKAVRKEIVDIVPIAPTVSISTYLGFSTVAYKELGQTSIKLKEMDRIGKLNDSNPIQFR